MLITFDVWNTLIKYNPDVSKDRNRLIAEFVGCSEDDVNSVYHDLKTQADKEAESGICWTQEILYSCLLKNLGGIVGDWKAIRRIVEDNFEKHPPFIHPELVTELKRLSRAHIFGIASNNNFISGEMINRVILRHLGVEFMFMIHSADIGAAKPGAVFLNHYAAHVSMLRDPYTMHIGDNPVCDNFGSYVDESILIENPADCVRFIKEISV